MLAGLGRAMRGEGEAAVELSEEALDVSPDRFESAFILACLGRAWCETGDTARAVTVLEQAVEFADQVRSLQFRAWFRTMLGEAYALHGEVVKSDAVVREALDISESTGFLLGIALAKQVIGRSAWMQRDNPRAARYLDEAIAIFIAIGHDSSSPARNLHWQRWSRVAVTMTLPEPGLGTCERYSRASEHRGTSSAPTGCASAWIPSRFRSADRRCFQARLEQPFDRQHAQEPDPRALHRAAPRVDVIANLALRRPLDPFGTTSIGCDPNRISRLGDLHIEHGG